MIKLIIFPKSKFRLLLYEPSLYSMFFTMYTLLWTVVSLVFIIIPLLTVYKGVGRKPPNFPPGPPTLPLIGNLHQIPATRPHIQFQKWAQEYGPVYSLILGTQVLIVLSTDQAVKDLLDKRSAIYSSRPPSYIAQDVLSGGLRVLLLEYGDIWKEIRKIAHQIMNVKVSSTYVPYQDLESVAMLMGFLNDPAEFTQHIRRYTSSIFTQMTYGFRINSVNDEYFKTAMSIFNETSNVIRSATAALLDAFPLLRSLPDVFLPTVKYAKQIHKREFNLFTGQYLHTREKLRAGLAKPCFCSDLVRMQDTEGYSDRFAAYLAGSLLQAGSETTSAILVGFIQAMVIFPDAMEAAQKEIDKVCGGRMPDLNDFPQLPFVRGCVKECLRWMPTTLLGVPHAVIRDDEYMGYRIPKGATVMYNVWTLHNDPTRYPNPRLYDPGRWVHDSTNSAESATLADVTQRDHFVFGAGRRLCQGMHIADRTLFLAISRLLWGFNIRRAVDSKTGVEILPDMHDLEDGLFTQPRPFPAAITPRMERTERIREEWAKMQDLLDKDMQWKEVPEGLIWKDYEMTE
ncbi:cytochrome P450 [Poronia punctata]|nr:cytochrome P450 [Poronia punctata]